MVKVLTLLIMVCVFVLSAACMGGDKFGLTPLSNNVSLFKNFDDYGADRGTTIQFLLMNEIRLLTPLHIGASVDFNYNYMPGMSHDYYAEIFVIKPLTRRFGIYYTRVESSFGCGVNQVGFRLSL
jgi:hypothetical protein